MSRETSYRTCPLCEATCGLEVTTEGASVVRIRGDRDDVFSHGFICPKGSTLKQLQEDPDRLRQPVVKRDGRFVTVGWGDVARGSAALYLGALARMLGRLDDAQAHLERALRFNRRMGARPSVVQRPEATVLPPVRGEIVFAGVTFGYQPDRPVLSHVDLRIRPGETVACVGPTGAGKSTLAKLVTRLYDPTEGSIRIDGHDLREVTLASLRRQIGVVPQEPFLFAGSLRDNIAFARPSATDAQVWAAVDAVGLRDLVERSPEGLLTPLHERGQSVSSGERQLLALARAFLAEPRVVVLDEATSSLDLRSELRVEAALDRLLRGRTAILVAHRLSTAMRADRIIVVDDHRIVESGSHDDLVAAGGRYAAMFETWAAHSAVR